MRGGMGGSCLLVVRISSRWLLRGVCGVGGVRGRLCFSRCVSVRVGCVWSWLVVVVSWPGAGGSFVADGAVAFGAGSEVWGEVGYAAGEVAWCAPVYEHGALTLLPVFYEVAGFYLAWCWHGWCLLLLVVHY